MKKMDPVVKAKWVAALRSGEYSQGKGELRSAEGSYCCLGVLCDISDSRLWMESPHGAYCWSNQREDVELPPSSLTNWAGLDWERTHVVIGGVEDSLYNHNDGGCTFAQIADAIEAQL